MLTAFRKRSTIQLKKKRVTPEGEGQLLSAIFIRMELLSIQEENAAKTKSSTRDEKFLGQSRQQRSQHNSSRSFFSHFLDSMSGNGSGFAPDQVHPEGRAADSLDEQQHLEDSDRCFQALQASQEVAVGQQPDHGKGSVHVSVDVDFARLLVCLPSCLLVLSDALIKCEAFERRLYWSPRSSVRRPTGFGSLSGNPPANYTDGYVARSRRRDALRGAVKLRAFRRKLHVLAVANGSTCHSSVASDASAAAGAEAAAATRRVPGSTVTLSLYTYVRRWSPRTHSEVYVIWKS